MCDGSTGMDSSYLSLGFVMFSTMGLTEDVLIIGGCTVVAACLTYFSADIGFNYNTVSRSNLACKIN